MRQKEKWREKMAYKKCGIRLATVILLWYTNFRWHAEAMERQA